MKVLPILAQYTFSTLPFQDHIVKLQNIAKEFPTPTVLLGGNITRIYCISINSNKGVSENNINNTNRNNSNKSNL